MTQKVDPLERAAQFLHYLGAKGLEELEAAIRQTSEDWARCLDGISEAQAAHQPDPAIGGFQTPASGEGPKWCVKEVIGHYLLSERSLNNTAAERAGVPPPANPGAPVQRMGAQSPEHEAMSMDGLRQRLAEFFDETVALIGRLQNSSKLEEAFPHPVFGPLNVKEWLAFHRLHAMDHIEQIARIKADAGYPKT
ncbi:MAG TPA: DinB family protein [Dehalococcoidia bacterium]|nr:DinB family protein [Dehalococcoidia bacterium]